MDFQPGIFHWNGVADFLAASSCSVVNGCIVTLSIDQDSRFSIQTGPNVANKIGVLALFDLIR